MPTVLHRLSQWADATPELPAQAYKEAGQWKTLTARDYRDRVYFLALYLESKGYTPKDVGAIFAYNSPQWVHLDLGLLLMGAKAAGLYPNSTPKDVRYILDHTEARVLGVQNAEYFKRIVKDGNTLPDRIDMIIVFDGDTSVSPRAVAYETAISEGRALANKAGAKKYSDFLAKIDAKAGAFMIYTSGTTGNPKGALLSHDNLAYTSDIVGKYWRLPATGSLFSFLPLCHIAEKLQNVGVGITQRYLVSFASKFENVGTELPEVEPTLLLSVPRLWEKMMEGVLNKVRKGTGTKKKMAEWALAVGERVVAAESAGKVVSPIDLIQFKLANKLVLHKIRKALGLGRAETLASGAAALPPHVSRWFRSIGLEILEDYGQTESTGVICMTEPGIESSGTVGRAVPGTEFKLAADGEILSRGRHVFVGYFKEPEATAATLVDGWLYTGDLAELDPRGLVKIRGRKKEIMKTSGGKMIAPVPIEERLKAAPMISQVCLVGDNRKFLSALITLAEAPMAELKGRGGAISGKVVTDEATVKEVRKCVDDMNRTLANFEQIKKVTVLANEFSIDDGEMTPTMKMKRNVIEQRYRDLIDQMYT